MTVAGVGSVGGRGGRGGNWAEQVAMSGGLSGEDEWESGAIVGPMRFERVYVGGLFKPLG